MLFFLLTDFCFRDIKKVITGEMLVINLKDKIKIKNIDVKMGLVKPLDLKSYGIKIPENLKRLAVFSLKEFIVIDDEKLEFVPLRKITPNQKYLFEEDVDLKSRTPFVSKYELESFFSEHEQNYGISFDCLVEKNKEFLATQLEMLSQRIWREQQGPLAKFFKGETQKIDDDVLIDRNNISIKSIISTTTRLKENGFKVPSGLQAKVVIDELAILSANKMLFVLACENDATMIRKTKKTKNFWQIEPASYEQEKLDQILGKETEKPISFAELSAVNKWYVERQLQKMAKFEKQGEKYERF